MRELANEAEVRWALETGQRVHSNIGTWIEFPIIIGEDGCAGRKGGSDESIGYTDRGPLLADILGGVRRRLFRGSGTGYFVKEGE